MAIGLAGPLAPVPDRAPVPDPASVPDRAPVPDPAFVPDRAPVASACLLPDWVLIMDSDRDGGGLGETGAG